MNTIMWAYDVVMITNRIDIPTTISAVWYTKNVLIIPKSQRRPHTSLPAHDDQKQIVEGPRLQWFQYLHNIAPRNQHTQASNLT